MSGPTNFTESNFLLAIISGDLEEAVQIASGMLPGERVALYEALEDGLTLLDRIDP